MAPSVYDELFDHMSAVRDALTRKYAWFTHDTPLAKLSNIRQSGLLPHYIIGCPPEVIARFGEAGRKIVCLHPLGAELRPTSSQRGPLARFAVPGIALPSRVGLDWSYDWSLADLIRKEAPSKPYDEVILDVARRRGSVASYEAIPPQVLSVWTDGAPDDPEQWQILSDVEDTDIKSFPGPHDAIL